jgi:hypothetical protein
MGYDVLLFCEIIESIQGITLLRQGEKNATKVRFYQGLKGTLVAIDVTDEDMPTDLAKIYMEQLGIRDLIPSIFPPKPTEKIIPLVEESVGNANDCVICRGVGKIKLGEDIVICNECKGTGEMVA